MNWYLWAVVVIAALLLIRGALITRMGIAERADPGYFVALGVGVVCLVSGLAIVLIVGTEVLSL